MYWDTFNKGNSEKGVLTTAASPVYSVFTCLEKRAAFLKDSVELLCSALLKGVLLEEGGECCNGGTGFSCCGF